MSRTTHIAVEAYTTPEGRPTCAANWETARCRFVQTRKAGLQEVCGCTGNDLRRGNSKIAEDGLGYLEVDEACPVWSGPAAAGAQAARLSAEEPAALSRAALANAQDALETAIGHLQAIAQTTPAADLPASGLHKRNLAAARAWLKSIGSAG